MFAVCANPSWIRRSVWAKAHKSARILTDSRDGVKHAVLQGGSGIFSFAKDKHVLANIFQALKQTGETTRACRFCLQVLNFLQTEGRSAFYRKFLRISNIKELWAMTRKHSRHSFLERKGDRRTSVDSWFLYVWIRESMLMFSLWSLTVWTIWLSADGHSSLPGG